MAETIFSPDLPPLIAFFVILDLYSNFSCDLSCSDQLACWPYTGIAAPANSLSGLSPRPRSGRKFPFLTGFMAVCTFRFVSSCHIGVAIRSKWLSFLIADAVLSSLSPVLILVMSRGSSQLSLCLHRARLLPLIVCLWLSIRDSVWIILPTVRGFLVA